MSKGAASPRNGTAIVSNFPRVVWSGATRRVAELIVAYNPKNRSSIEANKNGPLPVYLSSSNSTVISIPRQNPGLAGSEMGATTRRLVTLAIPSMC